MTAAKGGYLSCTHWDSEPTPAPLLAASRRKPLHNYSVLKKRWMDPQENQITMLDPVLDWKDVEFLG